MRRIPVVLALAVSGWAEPVLDLSVTVDLGRDLGQNFGTLFEGRDQAGRLTCGAGFASVYNTYHRGERLKLSFFVRPPQGRQRYTVEPIARAGSDSGVYPHGLGDDVFIHVWTPERAYRVWDSAEGQWRSLPNAEWPGYSAATVRGKRLQVLGDHIVFGGKPILNQAEAGGYRYSYFGQGHLYFYRRPDPGTGEEIKQVVAVPWSPYDDLNVDLSKAKTVELKFGKEFPYAWGQLGNEVLNCSNWGGLYAFDGTDWKVLVEADEKTSYQIYSMINYGDRLLMAQYPTGFLLSYDGKAVTTLTDWPPVSPGASPHAREAQTTAIYRGELMVGVWPWAELWRRDPDAGAWVFMQRMFTHPAVHATPVHAYETEAKAAGLVTNDLGLRLTAMVPYRGGLILGTSSKGGGKVLEAADLGFLTPAQRDEYGSIYRLRMPGNLAAVIAWQDRPTTLRFAVREGRMTIHQDGRELGSASLSPALTPDLSRTGITWARGVFGPLTGTIRAKRSE